MRIVDPETGRSYVEKRRVRYNEPRQPRELTFSGYRHYAFLGRDRTRDWFCAALDEARTEFAVQLWAYVVMPEHVHVPCLSRRRPGADVWLSPSGEGARCPQS